MDAVRKDALYFILLDPCSSQNGIRIRRCIPLTETVWTRVELLEVFDVDCRMDTDVSREVKLVSSGRDLRRDMERTRVFSSQVSRTSDAGRRRSQELVAEENHIPYLKLSRMRSVLINGIRLLVSGLRESFYRLVLKLLQVLNETIHGFYVPLGFDDQRVGGFRMEAEVKFKRVKLVEG